MHKLGPKPLVLQDVPLCRSYQLVLVDALRVGVDDAAGPSVPALKWGLGVLADGQQEVLGVWPEPTLAGSAWWPIFESLMARGVERIGFVAGNTAGFQGAVEAIYPGAQTLETAWDRYAVADLPARCRRKLRAGAAVMKVLRQSASRAVARKDSVLDLLHTAALAASALERAMLRIQLAEVRRNRICPRLPSSRARASRGEALESGL